jgi:hypothetical protein
LPIAVSGGYTSSPPNPSAGAAPQSGANGSHAAADEPLTIRGTGPADLDDPDLDLGSAFDVPAFLRRQEG